MKIKSVGKTRRSQSSSKTRKPAPKVTFTEILSHLEDDRDRSKEMLDQLLKDIEEKGKDLIEHRTVETLIEYRDMIKGFVEEAIESGYEIAQHRGFSKSGRSRIMRTVKEVDRRLLELTNMILKQEKKQIRLLEKLGQIQGLLVNLVL